MHALFKNDKMHNDHKNCSGSAVAQGESWHFIPAQDYKCSNILASLGMARKV